MRPLTLIVIAMLVAGCTTALPQRDITPDYFQINPLQWQPLPQGTIQRIAFGSCSAQYLAQPIWGTVIAKEPDVFLHIGDSIYADFDGRRGRAPTAQTMIADYRRFAAKPAFRRLRQRIPVMATWDDHDFGKNDGGAEYEFKESSRQIFLDFHAEPADSVRRQTPGVYDVRIFGPPGRRVQVLLLDTRYFRDPLLRDLRSDLQKRALNIVGKYIPNPDPEATLLGADQWAWLERQLLKPAELRLLISSTQVVAGEKGTESWGNFPLERKRLYDLIGRTGANGLIILSGDVHMAEVSRTDDGPYPLYDFSASNLAQTKSDEVDMINSYRRAVFNELNFGLVEIDWDAAPAPRITLKSIGLDGQHGFEINLSLAELQNNR